MKSLQALIFIVIAIVVSSCVALTPEYRICREWQREGKVIGTISSCTKCVNHLGDGNADAVNGCTIGMDASRLAELAQ